MAGAPYCEGDKGVQPERPLDILPCKKTEEEQKRAHPELQSRRQSHAGSYQVCLQDVLVELDSLKIQ